MSARKKPILPSQRPSTDDPAIVALLATLDSAELETQRAGAANVRPGPSVQVARDRAILWLIEHGLASDRKRPVVEKVHPSISQGNPRPGRLVGSRADPAPPPPPPRPQIITLKDVVREEVEWLWPGRFPYGMVSLITGNPGMGKSTLIGWLIANVTRGGPWPDHESRAKPGDALVIQDEESLSSAYRPRLDGFHARLDRVHFLKSVRRGTSDVDLPFAIARDCDAIDVILDQNPAIRLVLIDPLSSFLTGISGNNEAETREMLQPIFALAERRRIAVICVVHLSKNTEKAVLQRISGTFAIPQKARMVWYLSRDPDKKSRRLLSLVKGNPEGKTNTAIAFSYSKGRMRWQRDTLDLLAEDVDSILQRQSLEARPDARPPGRPAKSAQDASAFVLTFLGKGPAMLGTVEDQALACGLAGATFRRVVKTLLEEGKILKESRDEGGRFWLRLPDPSLPLDPPVH